MRTFVAINDSVPRQGIDAWTPQTSITRAIFFGKGRMCGQVAEDPTVDPGDTESVP